MFTFDEATPVREQRCSPEVLSRIVKDIQKFQKEIDTLERSLDDADDARAEKIDHHALDKQINDLEERIDTAHGWLAHFRIHGVYDPAQSLADFAPEKEAVSLFLGTQLKNAVHIYRQDRALFAGQALSGALIQGPFRDIVTIYGQLKDADDVPAYALHGQDFITEKDCYHRPEMITFGCWSKQQIGDFLYEVIQDMERPDFLLACLPHWQRQVVQGILQ